MVEDELIAEDIQDPITVDLEADKDIEDTNSHVKVRPLEANLT